MRFDKDQDLKELLRSPQFSETDLSGKVMKRLYAGQSGKERFLVKYKVSVMVIAGMLLTASSGFAAVQYQSLKNKQGEVTYQVKPAKEASVPQEEELQRWKISRDLGDKLLQEGSAAVFYVVAHNPNRQMDTRFKPVTFTDLSVLRSKLSSQPVVIADSLTGNYAFKSARVFFKPVNMVNPPTPEEEAATAEKLRKQAEASKQEYAMMPVELSNELLNIRTVYAQGKNEIAVTIVKSKGEFTAYVDEKVDFTSEKVVVDGVEMIYTKYKGGNSIVWTAEVPGSTELYQYQIDDMSGQYLSKADMIEIAKLYLR
ncbi:hypothetical protein [Paenibacillus riograndensis]|uniref:DUF4367 domain-containing protein n=1 Tax=Paenibacillus riograndensis SBR5 TaxID=1073571 RepID=A0A0E4D006_9BACL|nr:hypothetical protein [Paenibacillus riograndensis]CQR59114.1 hypothetical protein PRIO_6767 [Paenibacillus riograndensis SBR5]